MAFFDAVLNRREELEEQGRTNTCPRPGGEANNTMIELVTPVVASQLGGRNTQLAVAFNIP